MVSNNLFYLHYSDIHVKDISQLRPDSPSDKKKNPAVVQMSLDKSSEAVAVEASNLDHLILSEEKLPGNEEVFAPDPETEAYFTTEVLAAEKEADVYVSTPEAKSKNYVEKDGEITETNNQSKYQRQSDCRERK